jgi:hypothetical protein
MPACAKLAMPVLPHLEQRSFSFQLSAIGKNLDLRTKGFKQGHNRLPAGRQPAAQRFLKPDYGTFRPRAVPCPA